MLAGGGAEVPGRRIAIQSAMWAIAYFDCTSAGRQAGIYGISINSDADSDDLARDATARDQATFALHLELVILSAWKLGMPARRIGAGENVGLGTGGGCGRRPPF